MSRHSLRIHVLRGIGYTAATALGLVAATWAPSASADGLPVPSVTIPSPPISPPATLPTDPGGTQDGSTADSGGASAPAANTPSSAAAGSRTPAALEGAISLKDGAVSIPVTSVRAPARLVIDWVAFAPSV